MESRTSFLPNIVDDVAMLIVDKLNDEDLLKMALVSKKWQALALKATTSRYISHFKHQPNMSTVRSQYFALIKEEVKALYAIFLMDSSKDHCDIFYRWDKEYFKAFLKQVSSFSRTSVDRVIEEFNISPEVVERNQFLIEEVIKTIISLPINLITQEFINKLVVLKVELSSPDRLEENIALFDNTFKHNNIITNENKIKFLSLFHAVFCHISSAGLIELSKLLISKHPELPKIKFIRGSGVSMLHAAIDGMHYDLARYLIRQGADVDGVIALRGVDGNSYSNWSSSSPLFDALLNLNESLSNKENELTTQFILDLLNAGADPMLRCYDVRTDDISTPFLLLLDLRQNNNIKPMLNLFAGTMTTKALPKFVLLLLEAFSHRLTNTLKDKIITPVKNQCSIV